MEGPQAQIGGRAFNVKITKTKNKAVAFEPMTSDSDQNKSRKFFVGFDGY